MGNTGNRNTVKPILSSHPKTDKTKVLKTGASLVQVESIAIMAFYFRNIQKNGRGWVGGGSNSRLEDVVFLGFFFGGGGGGRAVGLNVIGKFLYPCFMTYFMPLLVVS